MNLDELRELVEDKAIEFLSEARLQHIEADVIAGKRLHRLTASALIQAVSGLRRRLRQEPDSGPLLPVKRRKQGGNMNEELNQATTALPTDHPLMKAWTSFCETDEFKNALRWAVALKYDDGRPISEIQREQHAKGAMWLAFTKGIEMSDQDELKWFRIMFTALNLCGRHAEDFDGTCPFCQIVELRARLNSLTTGYLTPSTQLLSKLGSIVVHADELLSSDGRFLDREVLLNLLNDPEVKAWIKSMGPLLPVKRRKQP